MKKLHWKEEFETHIDVIDDQHRKIVGLLNKIITSHESDSRHTLESEAIIEEFIEYITFHFNMEEYYASKYHFPGYNNLVEEHNIIRNMFNSLKYYYSKYTRPEHYSSTTVKYIDIVIVELFQAHFFGIDREFANFIKEQHVDII